MKHLNTIILLFFISLTTLAQSNYNETIAKADASTSYQALYILWNYQQQYPQYAPVYYEMAWRNAEIVPTLHPIRQHDDLQDCLYRTQLYAGNCSYMVKDQNVKAKLYSKVPHKGKNPTNQELNKYLIDLQTEAATLKAQSDSLYNSFCRLQQRYSLCNSEFGKFVEKYHREKDAHLLLTPEDRLLLSNLLLIADSLTNDIEVYQQALKKYPYIDIAANVHFMPIVLYRIDGLTMADMLQDEIYLWDYAAWVDNFLTEQNSKYTDYLQTIDKAHRNSNIDHILLQQINRIDYNSFIYPRMWLEMYATDMEHAIKDFEREDMMIVLQQMSSFYTADCTAEQQQNDLLIRLQQQSWDKYGQLLNSWGESDTTIFIANSKTYTKRLHTAYNKLSNLVYNRIKPTIRPFTHYTNDLTGETIRKNDLQVMGKSDVVDMVPVGSNYLVILPDATVLLNRVGVALRRTYLTDQITSPVVAAHKVNNNTVAIITSQRIVFVDNQGRVK